MILSDADIRFQVEQHQMIDPFVPKQSGRGTISYGLSSAGYDIRIADDIRLATPDTTGMLGRAADVIDPKRIRPEIFERLPLLLNAEGWVDHVLLPPHSFALAKSVERIKMPRNVTCVCMGKSTYARCGLIVNVTPLEPGWEGIITLELSNTTPLPAKVYVGEGIAQLVFHALRSECEVSYADRQGKYQNQTAVTLPIV